MTNPGTYPRILPENRAAGSKNGPIAVPVYTFRVLMSGCCERIVALAWLTAQPFPTFPLAGASRVEHVEALREAGDAVLTEEQRDYLRRMTAG